ncbi:hypothetical protein HYV57_04790 [Candidatus Peregrinibacteria bacterium]|nr:hypothetical protein [Candidatus Peregrinibacteria bacterium]
MNQNFTFEETIKKIKNLEIQGAEHIAILGIKAFGLKLEETSDPKLLQKYADELRQARPTEPALKNALHFCLKYYRERNSIKDVVKEVLRHFEEARKKIIEYGEKKIENNMSIFTHCHSSTVTAILIQAFRNGKKIRVYNTETRPRFQGRITAKELTEAGIPVDHFVDSAGPMALKKTDIFLFGSDAVTSDGRVINKIGTAPLLEFANEYRIPSFACTNSWKFDPETLYGAEEEIEQREKNEVWENPPRGVTIHNPAFETVSPDRVSGLITELGILKPESLVNAIQVAYPWLLER